MSDIANRRIDDVIRRLTVVSQPILVEGLARELLAERPVEFLAELLTCLGRRTSEERSRVVYSTVVRLALDRDGIPAVVREELYSTMAARGQEALVRFLLPVIPHKTAGRGELPHDPQLDDMPLGTRKWKARMHDRELLLRLARHGDPSVVTILLDNPRVTEADVVTWVARRPALESNQVLVARHRIWSSRPRIQEALARNPYTPTHLAAALLPLLPRPLLKEIATDGSLHELVREAAREVDRLKGEP
jgi:hypothetical protein